ncbi:MAG TPA: glycine betaine ABC transporter substrate-binding protein, partial [Dongiaceae bacterium]|nr:glycine betaine ABC transporter substrate-binding protein [Dongiaceae bacterium]
MKHTLKFAASSLAIALALTLAGCGEEKKEEQASSTAAPATSEAQSAATQEAAATPAAPAATEPESCKKVRLADVGWSDNTAQNGLFKTVLKGLGYAPEDQVLALPVIMESLKNKDLDIFLDNWMPSNAANVQPYLDAKTLDMLDANLTGAGYG